MQWCYWGPRCIARLAWHSQHNAINGVTGMGQNNLTVSLWTWVTLQEGNRQLVQVFRQDLGSIFTWKFNLYLAPFLSSTPSPPQKKTHNKNKTKEATSCPLTDMSRATRHLYIRITSLQVASSPMCLLNPILSWREMAINSWSTCSDKTLARSGSFKISSNWKERRKIQ